MERVTLPVSDITKWGFNPFEPRGHHGEWERGGGGIKPLPASGSHIWGLPSIEHTGHLPDPAQVAAQMREEIQREPLSRGQLVYVTNSRGERERGSYEGKTPEGKFRIALRSGDVELDPSEVDVWKPGVRTKMPVAEFDELVNFLRKSQNPDLLLRLWDQAAEVRKKKGGSAETLREYWTGEGHPGPTHGAYAKEIRWGTGGDFMRCVGLVTEHAHMSDEHAKGYCNLLHHRALGYWPAQHARMDRG